MLESCACERIARGSEGLIILRDGMVDGADEVGFDGE